MIRQGRPNSDSIDDELQSVADELRRADRVLFVTGAGLSADSGLPTYRGVGGLYEDRFAEEELPIETILSGDMLGKRPALTWKYLREVEEACRGAKPNAGHDTIAEIERAKPETWVLTQNVDGFHRAAGSRNLIEIHGCFSGLRCTRCGHRRTIDDYSTLPDLPELPLCPRSDCGALVRPDVILFGEMLPQESVELMQRELGRGFDMVFSVGTSSAFTYIIQPVLEAARAGVPTVEINAGDTGLAEFFSHALRGRAAELLPEIWRRAIG